MKKKLKDFIVFVSPSLKAAFIHAAKVSAYIILSAALAAAYAYITKAGFDPIVMVYANIALAAAQKAIDSLNDPTVTGPTATTEKPAVALGTSGY